MHKETDFERIIECEFLELAGYHKGDPDGYDKDNALFRREILDFIQRTQPKQWQRLAGTNPDNAETVLIDSLIKELKGKGILAVLREGFKCFGKTIYLAYFAPNTGMNPEAIALYAQNRLTITRQVHTRTGAIPDIVLSLNGLPIATLELKNPGTGQTYRDAIKQYREERDPIDPLFTFKQRCLVHFAVDTEEVWMTTRLDKTKTRFLPFNRGHNYGASNPPDTDRGYRTSYLWLDILSKDSLLEIIARFLHLETEQTLIFPRYHQLDAVRRLIHHAKICGSGHNYLIQHSAGSGKSNSIA